MLVCNFIGAKIPEKLFEANSRANTRPFV